MFTSPKLQKDAMSNNNNNNNNDIVSCTSHFLVRLLRRRASVLQWSINEEHNDADDEDLESCTTASTQHDANNDDEKMTMDREDHCKDDKGNHDQSRVTFNPHVIMVEFDKEEEGRQVNMWIPSEEWNRIDMELQSEIARLHLSVFSSPPATSHERPVHGEGDDDYESQDGDNNRYQEDESDDSSCSDDDDISYQDDQKEEQGMDTDKAETRPNFGDFRGLEKFLFPHRRQMRRRLLRKAVLSEQAQQDRHGNDAAENIAEASQVWSRRDTHWARERAQADAHVVRQELLREWKLQQQQQ